MASDPKRPILHVRAAAAKRGEPKQPQPELTPVVEEIATPTEESIRVILARIEEAFNAFGTDKMPGTIIPAGSRNNSREAADFVIAERLSKLAATRLKNATEAAEKVGVFGNPAEYINGETIMVFSDPNFSINIKMGNPSKMINREAVEEAANEFIPKRVAEFLERCFKPRAATKQIIVSMK